MLFLCPAPANENKRDQSAVLDGCIAGIARRDAAALALLYRETSASVYGFALSVLKNPQEAEDVAHDCFLRVYAAAGEYQSAGKPLAWILTITRNLCLSRLRDDRHTAPIADLPEDFLQADEGLPAEDRMLIAHCMTRLTDEERQIVFLHAVSGFRHREIAELLSLPLATVLSKYHRSIKKLRHHFEKGERQS